MPISAKTAAGRAPDRWFGWWRPDGTSRWTVLAEAPTRDDAWRELLARLPYRSGDAIVLADGRVP